MWDTSDRWDPALRVAHGIVTKAEVWRGGSYVQDINVVGGAVAVDESSKVRRSLTLTASDVTLLPDGTSDLLSPFGTDLRVYSGIAYTEGDTELVPVGVFRITDVAQRSHLAELEVTADDYSHVLADARFLVPWNTPAGAAVVDEIARMVHDVDPTIEVYDLTGSSTLTVAATWDRERWDAIEQLAASIGAEPFFDALGRLIVRPVPTVTSTSVSVWDVDSNTSTAVMLDVALGVSSSLVYNAVVASSSGSTSSPITGIAYQQSGDFKWQAGFKRPRFYSSPLLSTVEQCQQAASAILARSVVFARSLAPVAAPNPALDVGDVITVTLPDGTAELRVVSALTVPLDLNPMQIDTRVGVDALTASDTGSLS